MTTYYVRKSGSDGAAGTSPATAWATIGKALGASGIASGDQLWIGAGVYRETVIVGMTSATVETFVTGDTDGSHAGDAGEVVMSAWTSGPTSSPATGDAVIDLANRDHLTFSKLTILSDVGSGIFNQGSAATHITIQDCSFLVPLGGKGIDLVVPFGVAANWTIDRCRFLSAQASINVILTDSAAGSDYDAAIVIRNCLVMASGYDGIYVSYLNGLAKKGGGVTVTNCTVVAAGSGIAIFGSTTFPSTVTGCIVMAPSLDWGSSVFFALEAGAAGEMIEDYNVLYGPFPRANVTAGANSISDASREPALQIGQESAVGQMLRPFLSPMAGSALLGFGGTAPAVDILNAPRPAGGASPLTAVGAYERGNTFGKETGTVRSGTNAISITGPGYQDYRLRVNPVSTAVTVYVRWDATYAGTKPKLQVLHGTEAGVADATALAVGGSGSWEQLALTFTPTSQGIVTIRFLSSDTNGGGKMFVDDLLSIP